MAVVTDLATIAAATAAGYVLEQHVLAGDGGHSGPVKVAVLSKPLAGRTGVTSTRHESVGTDPASATTARTNALAALNAERRHRYAGSPGAASGSTVVTWPDGKTPTVDVD